MDFNMKKLVKDAGTVFNRVVQLTEEKLGTSIKTELDAQFEHLAERSDATKLWTEKLVWDTEAVLTPNPGNRVEDFLMEKIDKKKPNRLTNLEYLGLDMIQAGSEFGPGTAYGSTLIKVGESEKKLGHAERDYSNSVISCYVHPLRKFLDGEMKTILKERSILEGKRIDLDACKNRLRKARSMQGQQNAERDLRVAQSEFDRQAEITKLLLEGVGSSHASHLRYLHQFVETQAQHYALCHRIMQDLQAQIAGLSTGSTQVPLSQSQQQATNDGGGSSSSSAGGLSPTEGSAKDLRKRARVLFNYEAKDSSELSLVSNEVIVIVEEEYELEPDYAICERGSMKGKVPRAYLEILSY
ncbi:endophilin-B1 isoform X2 [Ischnura elegans]|uniref:endophilin-B1 isoform X2 n=1 Tax=Ischnura elegans TaxID=197161 RepID=UPI001ED898F5|nr:endophilin-B1 isoform X2 [Ischnura elegans]